LVNKGVNKLNHTLGKAYGGEIHLIKCLDNQRFSLSKEGLGYTVKNGMSIFVTKKTSSVKNNGWFCSKCKQVGYLKQHYKTRTKLHPLLSLVFVICL
jgi:hypothetical protein